MKLQSILVVFAAIQLSSAASFAASGAVDHAQMVRQSAAIETQFHQFVMNDARFNSDDCARIQIHVAGKRATLTGTVNTNQQVQAAEDLARKAGAMKVDNLMSSFEELNQNAG